MFDPRNYFPPGYGPHAVGFDFGHALNLALNPLAQMHAVGDYAARHGHGNIASLLDPVGALHGRFAGHPASPGGYPYPPSGSVNVQHPGLPPSPTLAPWQMQGGGANTACGGNSLRAPLGLGSGTFTNAAPGDILLTQPLQSSFLGQRLICSQAKSAGAVGLLVTITKPLAVSGMPQTPNPDSPQPIEMFEADSTFAQLDLNIATAGTSMTLTFHISAAPAVGESVSVSAGVYGIWIR